MGRSRSGAEETDVSITPPKTWEAGVPAVADPLRFSLEQTTVRRTALTPLNLNLNQAKGFGRPGCVRSEPDPAHRHPNENCENDAKHVGNGATSNDEHDHAARLLERTTTRAADATVTAPRSHGP
ncbi:hypothetical protein ACWEN3_07760 [Streptomyces sp. NPDC004561]